VSAEGNKPRVQVEYKGETKTFTPEEISSMVLLKMKETAEAFLGQACKVSREGRKTMSSCFDFRSKNFKIK